MKPMTDLASQIALQHLINAYVKETGRGCIISPHRQSSAQKQFSQGKPLLWLCLSPFNVTAAAPLAYVSDLGRHRLADAPSVWREHRWRKVGPVALASLLLEDLSDSREAGVDTGALLERWIQSRDALTLFLHQRAPHMEALSAVQQSFIYTEQALLLGHAMHPAPKSRQGFMADEMVRYSPETQGRFQMHYWLVHPDAIAESFAGGPLLSERLAAALEQSDMLNKAAQSTLQAHPGWRLLPMHPWQARYLMGQPVWAALQARQQVRDLGELGWALQPTTSVRTLAGGAPWMFKPSLSVAITNSVRINKAHECLRGEISCRLWRSPFGQQLMRQFPTLGALNDPGWIAITLDGAVVDETICIVRDNPFGPQEQITCMASLCQDHPMGAPSRLAATIDALAQRTGQQAAAVAAQWFERFLAVAVLPMLAIYSRYGMAFEAHQQNTLVELNDLWPARFWLRDNQGFYYIQERAGEVLSLFPELAQEADSVGPESFVQDRFIYYFFGNTLFGLISALGATGHVSEADLLVRLRLQLLNSRQINPALIDALLTRSTLPYKANLLTRLHDIDELVAPLESQSVYVQVPNPLFLHQKEVANA